MQTSAVSSRDGTRVTIGCLRLTVEVRNTATHVNLHGVGHIHTFDPGPAPSFPDQVLARAS